MLSPVEAANPQSNVLFNIRSDNRTCGLDWREDEDSVCRPARPRFHDHHCRPALHPAIGRPGGRRHQDRGTGGRRDALAAAAAQWRQQLFRPAQRGQEERRSRSERRPRRGGGASARRGRRHSGRELSAGRDASAGARLWHPRQGQPGSHLLLDLGLRPDRSLRRFAGLRTRDPRHLRLRSREPCLSKGSAPPGLLRRLRRRRVGRHLCLRRHRLGATPAPHNWQRPAPRRVDVREHVVGDAHRAANGAVRGATSPRSGRSLGQWRPPTATSAWPW